jgi:hypothetical protein
MKKKKKNILKFLMNLLIFLNFLKYKWYSKPFKMISVIKRGFEIPLGLVSSIREIG